MDSTSLKAIIGEQIRKLHSGKGDPKVANSIANNAGKMIAIARMELDFAKMTGLPPAEPFLRVQQSASKKRLPK